MAVTYNNNLKTARMAPVLTAIDGGAGVGTLVIGTSALSGATGVLATIPLQKPSFTNAAQALTIIGTPSVVASATGTAAKAEIRDSTGLVIVTGLTVGISASDVIVGTVSFNSGNTITISSAVISHG